MTVAGLVAVSGTMAGAVESPVGGPPGETAVEEAAPPAQMLLVEVAKEEPAPEPGQATGSPPAERMHFSTQADREEMVEYDPWEPLNEKTFAFNHGVVDRLVVKPLATVWDTIIPDLIQEGFSNAFDNLAMPRRVVNNVLQGKFRRAGLELTRFFVNTVFGVAGFMDIAKGSGLRTYDEDTGQTLGFYGVDPGPYLVLPFLTPLTLRDGVGYVVDLALDPMNYFIPLAASMGRRGGEIINTRSQNLEFFESVEENTVDLYSAVRNAYLQRRQRAIEE